MAVGVITLIAGVAMGGGSASAAQAGARTRPVMLREPLAP